VNSRRRIPSTVPCSKVWIALYGYTSNEHGLRHGLLEADAKAGFAEAKFMIVACSAFVSFLIARAAESSP
jgi:hypothetical protein